MRISDWGSDVCSSDLTIARVGSSGHVDRPQLHFEVRRGTRAVDPQAQLSPRTASAADSHLLRLRAQFDRRRSEAAGTRAPALPDCPLATAGRKPAIHAVIFAVRPTPGRTGEIGRETWGER